MTDSRPKESEKPDSNQACWSRFASATLAVAFILRVWLALAGGQGYWPDETRFEAARNAVTAFSNGQSKSAWMQLIGGADHLFFKLAAVPAACLDHKFGISPARDAIYLGLFSLGALALIGSCARAAKASEREAAVAVFFAATANSLFYYTRHLFPYDVSLFFCMGALRLSLGERSIAKSLGAGLMAGIGFLSYDGYWILGGAILVFHVLSAPKFLQALRSGFFAAIGLALPVLTVVFAVKRLGGDLVDSFRKFSETITQGDFGQGHTLVWEYLWSAEGVMLLFWFGCALYAVIRLFSMAERPRPLGWLLLIVGLYAGLCLFADGIKLFVVYGRTARILVPFSCLLSAWSLNDWWSRKSLQPKLQVALLGMIAVVAGFNFLPALRQQFPDQFLPKAGKRAEESSAGLLRLLNVNRLSDATFVRDTLPRTVWLAAGHPMQFRPYLFEGCNEAQRRTLTENEVGMKLVEMTAVPLPARVDDYPGALRLRLKFPDNRFGYAEPLLTAGDAGHQDVIAVRYIDFDHIRFYYASQGYGTASSDLIHLDYSKAHELVVFYGGMLPEKAIDQEGVTAGANKRLRQDVLLVLDGQTVLAAHLPHNPTQAQQIHLGMNFGSEAVALEAFTGEVNRVEAVSQKELLSVLPEIDATALVPGNDWEGYPGPIHLSLTLSKDRTSGYEPVVTTGGPGASDCLYLLYQPNAVAQVAFAHAGEPPVLSAPFKIPEDGRFDTTVLFGSLMPSPESKLYRRNPALDSLRGHLWVQVNGAVALSREMQAYPAPPSTIKILQNSVGAVGVGSYFTGRLNSVNAADASAIAALVKLNSGFAGLPGPPIDGYYGPLQIKIRVAHDITTTGEPIVTSGVPGAGDFIYVRSTGPHQARFGVDHWGSGGAESDSVDLGPSPSIHTLVVSTGALFPEETSRVYVAHPQWKGLRAWVVVIYDGKVVLKANLPPYPSTPDRVSIGSNTIGGSSARPQFSGTILSAEPVSPDIIGTVLNSVSALKR